MLTIKVKKQLQETNLAVDLTVGAEIIAIVGPSGAGKTTILNMIAGITEADEGMIRYKDVNFVEDGKQVLPIQARKIGYVFQDYALFPHKTVEENIMYSVKDRLFIESLMGKLSIAHLRNKYPHEVSGGEQQRVALLRAYAMQPNILLLDEPFSALDEETKEKSYAQLLSLHEATKTPIILVTHNRGEVKRIAGRAYELKHGELHLLKRE